MWFDAELVIRENEVAETRPAEQHHEFLISYHHHPPRPGDPDATSL